MYLGEKNDNPMQTPSKVVGNELNLSPKQGEPVNPKVYDAASDIVDYIHANDPNHPVTTPMAGAQKEQVKVALEGCPNLDFISAQVYGGLGNMGEMVKSAGITIPFAITEYGPIGHWERPQTAWGREIKKTSCFLMFLMEKEKWEQRMCRFMWNNSLCVKY